MRVHKSILKEFIPANYTRTTEGLMLKVDYLKSGSKDINPRGPRGDKNYQPVNSISGIFLGKSDYCFYLDKQCNTNKPLVAVTLDKEREKIAVITNKGKEKEFENITIDAGGKGRGYDTNKFTKFEDEDVNEFIEAVVKSENGKN